jgi:hypothetical protein
MKKLALAVGVLALGFTASTAVRADYAVVMFKDGHCRPWADSKAAPAGAGWKYHWVGLNSWQFAESKKHYALKKHWCKSFYP